MPRTPSWRPWVTASWSCARTPPGKSVGQLLDGVVEASAHDLSDAQWTTLEAVADFIALAQTAVETDYRGDAIDAHAPEVPTRLVKELGQVVRGATALGLTPDEAFRLALRVARDCVPPARLAVLLDVAAHPGAKATEIRHRLDKPRSTVVRLLDALHALHLLTCEEYEVEGKPWLTLATYSLAETVDTTALESLTLSGNVSKRGVGVTDSFKEQGESESEGTSPYRPTHIPGHPQGAPTGEPAWVVETERAEDAGGDRDGTKGGPARSRPSAPWAPAP
jgi:hypothetical protein